MRYVLIFTLMLFAAPGLAATPVPGAWVPDQGDGSYRNPVLQGDYSDPDAIRVGDDFYLTSSSFSNVPGLPILHSRDMVNWQIIGHALPQLNPVDHYRTPRRGGGVWAPALRFHAGRFYIYYPDPDFGIYMVSARDPKGPWSAPVLVDATKGAIDPCPFWDDDGRAYLIHAFAKSRAGKNNMLVLKPMNADGTHTLGEGRVLIDGAHLPQVKTSLGMADWSVIEGPKLYKRDGWYYIFAPADGVKNGWQAVFRARTINGPYEARDVMDQGPPDDLGPANGPHQGALVDAPDGKSWFLHFQDTDSYGRRVWLEPVTWKNDWPVIGREGDNGIGRPVAGGQKPVQGQPVSIPVTGDDFAHGLNLGWQWNANPGADWADTSTPGLLRLKAVPSSANLWEAGNVLTQKLPAMGFSVTTRMTFAPRNIGERAGLILFGRAYGFIGLVNTAQGVRIEQVVRDSAKANAPETTDVADAAVSGPVWLKMTLVPYQHATGPSEYSPQWPAMLTLTDAKVSFSYSLDGQTFTPLGNDFVSQPGEWVGAQIGLFAQAPYGTPGASAVGNGSATFGPVRVLR
ncbi:glycoside hydrolase 43 family protein [Asticcacaulis sp. EMRT-3]|uniref:glycoside hydrolase family 43 protein n=1 Tax=Asticcacaulis sp. EMRT-3 TaxID=3040349 RepID=UPI0024AF8218|nr:glycoside hydrolase 43 family protein [Asticcacaulis sp. EMRT-3]MDI7776492.1 glycoside hydrolase 43 family protein [Asticcacaulis sp. EMRT-3]